MARDFGHYVMRRAKRALPGASLRYSAISLAVCSRGSSKHSAEMFVSLPESCDIPANETNEKSPA